MRRTVLLVLVLVLAGCSADTTGRPSTSDRHRSPTITRSDSPKPAPTTAPAPSGCTGAVPGHDRPYDVELCAAIAIPGVRYHTELSHFHVAGTVRYDTSPPVGGDHSPLWANCTGTVYTHPIANENAVHMLEHGAVWITYNPRSASASDIANLTDRVDGVDYTALSPYPDLRKPISLQAWGYQLFVDRASDPRVSRFLAVLRHNPRATPERNVSCVDPYFHVAQSYPGHPQDR